VHKAVPRARPSGAAGPPAGPHSRRARARPLCPRGPRPSPSRPQDFTPTPEDKAMAELRRKGRVADVPGGADNVEITDYVEVAPVQRTFEDRLAALSAGDAAKLRTNRAGYTAFQMVGGPGGARGSLGRGRARRRGRRPRLGRRCSGDRDSPANLRSSGGGGSHHRAGLKVNPPLELSHRCPAHTRCPPSPPPLLPKGRLRPAGGRDRGRPV
jgi:hypothetical protein